MTRPLELTVNDQEILETIAENGPNFGNSSYLPTIPKVLVAFARTLLNLQQANKPRSVPISERAMEAHSWEDIQKLNDLDFLVYTAGRGGTARYFNFDAYMKKFAPIIARSILTNHVPAQPYKDSFNGCCKCGRPSFHAMTEKCHDKMEW